MELRRSVRGQNVNKVVFSDEEDEEVLTKKTKLSINGAHTKIDQIATEEYGFGKRVRRKSVMFKNYKLYDDSDSDFESGYKLPRKYKSKRIKNPKAKELNKIELLLDWKRDMIVSKIPQNKASYKVLSSKKIVEADLKQYGNDLQALFINIKWYTKYSPNGVKIEDFKKLDLNKKLMKNGIVFIWSEKEILGKLMKIMEEKGFAYIENFVIALLNPMKINEGSESNHQKSKEKSFKEKNSPSKSQFNKKKKAIMKSDNSDSSSTNDSPKKKGDLQEEFNCEDILKNLDKYSTVEADQLFYDGESDFLRNSKRVLMMFRRNDSTSGNLELRHQRTSDSLFDLVDPSISYGASDLKTKEYVYKLIETLLPKAAYNPQEKSLKMMEIWADPARAREGWISICEKALVC